MGFTRGVNLVKDPRRRRGHPCQNTLPVRLCKPTTFRQSGGLLVFLADPMTNKVTCYEELLFFTPARSEILQLSVLC
jgi:hypothetical protein